jgi:hypothetical protein
MRRIVSALEHTKSPLTAVALAAVHAEVMSPQDDYKSKARSSPKATIVA